MMDKYIDKYKVGGRFSAKIKGIFCKGKLQKEGHSWFLCQNHCDGQECLDKLGYKHSWSISADGTITLQERDVTHFKLLDEEVCEGSILIDEKKNKRQVLGVCGEVYFLSSENNFKIMSSMFTKYELDLYGFKLFTEEKEDS